MKHGHRAKAKTAKTLSKPSNRKSGAEKPSAKAASGKQSTGKSPGGSGQKAKPASKGRLAADNGKTPARKGLSKDGKVAASRPSGGKVADADVTFTTPEVGAAFKRALKKYPTALKRLTD